MSFMKVVLNTQNIDIQNDFLKTSKNNDVEIIIAKAEKILFNNIKVGDVNAFLLHDSSTFSQKAVDFIKKKHPYIPVIIFGENILKINNADIYVNYITDHNLLFNIIVKNLIVYENNFSALQRLMAKITEKISFNSCVYDPNKRMLYHEEKEVLKLSEKSGGILEMLASNYGKTVKKDLILERIWRKNDYYSGRSMDVYITGLRKIFRENNIDIQIKNISGVGLILE